MEGGARPGVDYPLLHDYIRQLQGVLYAQVVQDESGQVAELHVLSDRSRSPKQLVRDIQSVAMARFGLAIDHKVVSVAQIDGAGAPPPERVRLRAESFSFSRLPDCLQARVTLRQGEDAYEGAAEGLPSHRERNAILVRATLDALAQYMGGTRLFSLAEVKTTDLAGGEVVLVCLAQSGARQEDLLVGAALTWEDPQMAVVRATLAAVNRRLPLLIQTL